MTGIRHMSDWARKPGHWHGRVTGGDLGGPVSILFFASATEGDGPPLHTHPYDEVFICRAGKARFTIGDEEIVAQEGDVLIAPAQVPHKFAVLGPGCYESIDIHCNAEVIQNNLE